MMNSESTWPRTLPLLLLLSIPSGIACGSRSQQYSAPLGTVDTVPLTGSVALFDRSLQRISLLTSPEALSLELESMDAPENVQQLLPSPDQSRLLVLSAGVEPRLDPEDEGPQLLVLDGSADAEPSQRVVKRFLLDDPMQNLSLDPRGRWVAAFGGTSSLVNPNELVLLDLEGSDDVEGAAIATTIRSFGGAPRELLFTDELSVPEGGARRFLIVRTDRDITLLDLEHLDRPEVTLVYSENTATTPPPPLQVIYDDGDPDDATDALLAVRLGESSDVILATFGPPDTDGKDFSMKVNIVDVGGVPSFIDFVRTDGGLRLAALVPSRSDAVLVDPGSTVSEVVDLPLAFTSMRRITAALSSAPEGGDVALLWGASSSIAFWSLGSTSKTPYRSVSTAQLSFPVTTVQDVPAPNQHLKVLRGVSPDVFVLDLESRQSFPLESQLSSATTNVSADGERLWVYQEGSGRFSAVELPDLHPRSLYVSPGVAGVYDVERADGGRSAIVLHRSGGLSATVMDASDPSSSETAYFPALHLRSE